MWIIICAVTGVCVVVRKKQLARARRQRDQANVAASQNQQQHPYPGGVQSVFDEGNVAVQAPQNYPPPPLGSYPTQTYPATPGAYPTQTYQSSAVDPSSYTTQDMPPNTAPLIPLAVYQPRLSDSNQPTPPYVAVTGDGAGLPPPSYDECV